MRATALLLGLGLTLALGCHREPKTYHPKEGELPPLPPASGTPVGYLLDAATDLKLRDDQITKLKDIDASLAARNASIDTQLRQIERPEEDEPQQRGPGGRPPKRHNNAPGAAVKTSADASKLHAAHTANDRDALKAAFALLDPTQQEAARRLIEDHGFEAPGSQKKIKKHDDDSGTPALPGEP
jgi:hypothetical protein